VATEKLPSVVVVDPRFDAYGPLSESARAGRLSLHFRGSGSDALRLARRREVDAWLVAAELDDMSGHDFVELLRRQRRVSRDGESKLLMVDSASPGGRQWTVAEREATASGADGLLSHPITFEDLEKLLGLPIEERSRFLASASGISRAFVTVPVGVGAAAIAMALLFAG
jgi:CheY-like chemotaxis protein